MTEYDELTLWVGACSYYLGRMTYAVTDFCSLLEREWPTLHKATKDLIKTRVEEAFAADQRADSIAAQHGVERSPMFSALGMECDKNSWRTVRKLWSAQ